MPPETAAHDGREAPRVSVIVPAYNSAAYIRGTLASVVGQQYHDFELIVSDDGSADATVDVVRAFLSGVPDLSWRVLENRHGGPGATRNAGVRAAAGEWIAFLDSDDLWMPTKLQLVMDYAAAHPRAVVIGHSVLWLYPDRPPWLVPYYRMYRRGKDPFMSMWRRPILSTSAVVVKREHLIAAGLFDESLPNNQDYDLWLRLTRTFVPEYVPDILSFYLKRPEGISNNHEGRLTCMLRIGDKYLDDLSARARLPLYERRRFRSKAYFSSARALIEEGQTQRGLALLTRAVTAWMHR